MNARRTLGAVAAFSLFASSAFAAPAATPVATSAPSCLSPAQQSAFDVGALKSELSVLAVTCGNEEDYNRFVEKHRGELVAEDAEVNAFFKKQYGKAAQPRYDAYITLLANSQGQIGMHQGSDYCPRLKVLFTEVQAVPSKDLPAYAAIKDLQPSDLTPCAVPAVATTRSSSRSSHHPAKTTHKR